MPAKTTNGGSSAAAVDQKLPQAIFVMRGHVREAFGLTKEEMRTLVDNGTFRAEYPFGQNHKARFLRTQVLAVARKWES